MVDNKYTIGYYPIVYDDLINEFNHLLIAGSTGSGKSVCLNGIIYTLLYRKSDFIMIDLKRVELIDYKPISIMYCDTVQQAENALYSALNIIDNRYGSMQRKRLKMSDESPVYICIDECADLFLNSRVAKKLVIRIAQIGRAARVHLILCTQCTLAKLLDTQLLVNFDFRIGLRTATKNHSRLIIGSDGLESLPFPKTAGHAEMIISKPGSVQKWIMPYIDSEVIRQAIEIRKQKPKRTLIEKIKGLFE